MTRAIPQAATDLVRDQEETHLFVYDDAFYPPREAMPGDHIVGTLTAGTGHTGVDVVIGMVVTEEMDAGWLTADLNGAAGRIIERIGAVVDAITENQWAALLDFVFNMGAGASWTIWKRLKAKQFDQVPLELQKFVNIRRNGGFVKSTDLVNRRAAEIKLWASGEPGIDDAPVSSSLARQTGTTPPTPADPVPVTKSKVIIGGVTGAVTGAPVLCDQIIHAISHYAEHSHQVEQMLGGLALIAAVCAAVTITYAFIQKHNMRN